MTNYDLSSNAPEFSGKTLQEIRQDFPEAQLKHVARAESLLENLRNNCTEIFAEGDSWFDFPGWIVRNKNSDILDTLDHTHKYVVHRDSNAGDTVNEMVQPISIRRVRGMLATIRPSVFLLSGGGNDIFEGHEDSSFARMLNDDNPSDPIDYSVMESELDLITGQIAILADLGISLGIPVITHGYATPPANVIGKAAVPFFAGPWIMPILKKKGYNREQGESILKVVVEAFNSKLLLLANKHDLVYHIDLTESLKNPDLWHDELHLWSSGWKVAAETFHNQIQVIINER